MKIHVLAPLGNVQASSHPPKPSNPFESNKKQRKLIEIHLLSSIGTVQASPHPPYISKPLGTVPNMMETNMQKKRSAAEAEPIN